MANKVWLYATVGPELTQYDVDVDAATLTRRDTVGLPEHTGEGVAYGVFVKIHDRLAVVFLIARVHQRVQRQRIIVRRGDVFLDQGAEYASFDRSEMDIHVVRLEHRCLPQEERTPIRLR